MDRLYAFIDESGAFGGDTRNPSVSKYFIVSECVLAYLSKEALS